MSKKFIRIPSEKELDKRVSVENSMMRLRRPNSAQLKLITHQNQLTESKNLVLVDSLIGKQDNMFQLIKNASVNNGIEFDREGRPIPYSLCGGIQTFKKVSKIIKHKRTGKDNSTFKEHFSEKRLKDQVSFKADVVAEQTQNRLKTLKYLQLQSEKKAKPNYFQKQSIKKLDLIEDSPPSDAQRIRSHQRWYQLQRNWFDYRNEIRRILEFLSRKHEASRRFELSLRNNGQKQLQLWISQKSNSLLGNRKKDQPENKFRFFRKSQNESLLIQKIKEYHRLMKGLTHEAEYLELKGVNKFFKEKEALQTLEQANVEEMKKVQSQHDQIISRWDLQDLRRKDALHLRATSAKV